jgi:purine operon repressor
MPEEAEARAGSGGRVGGQRAERLSLLTQMLTAAPGRLLSLGRLADELGVAKSTLSEDLGAISRALAQAELGEVLSLTGAAGGVVYRPAPGAARIRRLQERLCGELNGAERHIAGGFVFTTDLVFSPTVAHDVGEVFAGRFWRREPGAVVTLETKGIPLALMTAHALGVPLVTVRRDADMTEGPALGIHYVSGSSRVHTMTLPRRALLAGTRVLIVDDFLKAGGTARGLLDLLDEFGAEAVGLAVLIETAEPEEKLVRGHDAFLRMRTTGPGAPRAEPSPGLAGAAAGRPERVETHGAGGHLP